MWCFSKEGYQWTKIGIRCGKRKFEGRTFYLPSDKIDCGVKVIVWGGIHANVIQIKARNLVSLTQECKKALDLRWGWRASWWHGLGGRYEESCYLLYSGWLYWRVNTEFLIWECHDDFYTEKPFCLHTSNLHGGHKQWQEVKKSSWKVGTFAELMDHGGFD